jgi:hypothetical protein
MHIKPQLKSLSMRGQDARDVRMTSWRLMTSVVPCHTCGWGAESP